MNEDQFYQFAADQYHAELSGTDRILARLSFVASGIVVGAGFLGYITTLSKFEPHLSVYYASAAAATTCLERIHPTRSVYPACR